jgi:hypothetical protein
MGTSLASLSERSEMRTTSLPPTPSYHQLAR